MAEFRPSFNMKHTRRCVRKLLYRLPGNARRSSLLPSIPTAYACGRRRGSRSGRICGLWLRWATRCTLSCATRTTTPTRELHKLAARSLKSTRGRYLRGDCAALQAESTTRHPCMLAYPRSAMASPTKSVESCTRSSRIWFGRRSAYGRPGAARLSHRSQSPRLPCSSFTAVRRRSFARKPLAQAEGSPSSASRTSRVDICRRAAHTMCASRSEARFFGRSGFRRRMSRRGADNTPDRTTRQPFRRAPVLVRQPEHRDESCASRSQDPNLARSRTP